MDYSQSVRIEAAKRLLESGRKAVDEIAEAVGYGNHAFFRRLFKRYAGLTPSQYRRMFGPILELGASCAEQMAKELPRR